MINGITVVSIVMTMLFLFAVYEALRSINKKYDRLVNYRELNDLTSSHFPKEDLIYPLTKTVKVYTQKHTSQDPVSTPYQPVIKKYEDANIFSSQKLLYHTPDPAPTSKFNRLILNQLSQKATIQNET